MFKKLEELEKKYEELNKNLSDPKIIANQSKFQESAKLHSDISKIVLKYIDYKNVAKEIEENLKMLTEENDVEFKKLINEELEKLEGKKEMVKITLQDVIFPID